MNFEKTVEEITCADVINLNLKDAMRLIRERDLIYHVLEVDGQSFPRKDPCFISERINLFVRKGKIIGTEIY